MRASLHDGLARVFFNVDFFVHSGPGTVILPLASAPKELRRIMLKIVEMNLSTDRELGRSYASDEQGDAYRLSFIRNRRAGNGQRHGIEMTQHAIQKSAVDWIPSIGAALAQIELECGRDQWDGERSVVVNRETISMAIAVLSGLRRLLPVGTPLPDIAAEADGEVGVSWILGAGHMFWISVNATGKVNFAGRFGTEGEDHGWRSIDRSTHQTLDRALRPIAEQIQRLFPGVQHHHAGQ